MIWGRKKSRVKKFSLLIHLNGASPLQVQTGRTHRSSWWSDILWVRQCLVLAYPFSNRNKWRPGHKCSRITAKEYNMFLTTFESRYRYWITYFLIFDQHCLVWQSDLSCVSLVGWTDYSFVYGSQSTRCNVTIGHLLLSIENVHLTYAIASSLFSPQHRGLWQKSTGMSNKRNSTKLNFCCNLMSSSKKLQWRIKCVQVQSLE